ncbi:ABC-type multidrug transport system ATPase subunit [Kroppenstedtia sanguinis]|uniref:ABC transporter ATP-binding protein n=1 Tax=Kroppenstedtia sanguinis TaxID=1380684 RepID=UPI003D1F99E2
MGELIRIDEVSKGYPSAHGTVTPLNKISAEIPKGRLSVFMGSSGTGKSTLFRLLNRLENPDEGEITYLGIPLTQWDPVHLRREIHYVHQTPILFLDTVEENLSYPLSLQGEKASADQMRGVLKQVGLSESFLKRPVDSLSGGEKQRVNLARSLMLNSPVLMLDEPTSSLDPQSTETVEKMMIRVRDLGRTVLLISHQREQAERMADLLWKLEEGQLILEEVKK